MWALNGENVLKMSIISEESRPPIRVLQKLSRIVKRKGEITLQLFAL